MRDHSDEQLKNILSDCGTVEDYYFFPDLERYANYLRLTMAETIRLLVEWAIYLNDEEMAQLKECDHNIDTIEDFCSAYVYKVKSKLDIGCRD
jgi:hypothetical protein